MRNLKRALSLAVASVMLLGMMVVGSGAASYTDEADIENVTAVEVLNALGVMVGNDDGSFGAKEVVTRAEMAVIVCNILYGDKLNVGQFAGTHIFTDVPAWAEGYVNLAASLGIVAGVGDNRFDPDAPVTTAQATLMLCRALGYFQNQAEFGSDWALAAVTRGTKLGLFGDLRLATHEGLTRDNVAQLVFNTLTEAVPVMYNANFDIYYNDSTAWTQGVNYNWYDTLGYTNFDLAYDSQNGVDDFGRPTTLWGTGTVTAINSQTGKPTTVTITKDNEIITVPADTSYTFQGKVTAKTLYDTIGSAIMTDTSNWELFLEVDGKTQTVTKNSSSICNEIYSARTDNDTAFQGTGVSSLTEIFLDADNHKAYIAITNLYAAEVTRVRENDDGEFIATLSIKNKPSGLTDNTIEVAEGEYAKDDIVVVTVAVDEDEVKTIAKAEKVSGEVTAVKSGKYIKVDDTQYDAAVKYYNLANGDASLAAVDTDVDIYLDTYGNMIAADTQDTTKDYLYVEDAVKALGGLDAKVIFADGTEARINIVKVDAKDANLEATDVTSSKVFTYTVDSDEYTLTSISGDDEIRSTSGTDGGITKGSASISVDSSDSKTAVANNKTVFVDVENNKVYTGYQNVPTVATAAMYVVADKTSGLADIVFITSGVDNTTDDYWFYVAGNGCEETKVDGATLREYTVYTSEGEVQLTTKNLTLSANTTYKVKTVTSEGYVTATEGAGTDFAAPLGAGADAGNVKSAENGVLSLSGSGGVGSGDYSGCVGKTLFTYDEDTVFLTITAKSGTKTDSVEIGNVNDIIADGDAEADETESIVYILSVDDKADDTPLVTLALIVIPA